MSYHCQECHTRCDRFLGFEFYYDERGQYLRAG
jgi:hypothetical protein